MRIALVVMADVLVLVVALLAVNEYHGLRRFASFTVPFTDKLIACGAVEAGKREQILRQDRLGHIVGIVLSAAVWIMLTAFFAGVSGAVIFPMGVAALLVLMRPDSGESAENREQYYRAHKNDIDDVKYHKYLESLAGTSEDTEKQQRP